MMQIKLFDQHGQHEGTFDFPNHAITGDALGCAAEVFSQGGHAEVWHDDVRVFDDLPTDLDTLTDQFANAKCEISAALSENEKGGLEIRFAEKPDEVTRTKLTENGWRYHQLEGCWYKRRSDAARAFAEELIS